MRNKTLVLAWVLVALCAIDTHGDPGRFGSLGKSGGGWFGGLFSSSKPKYKPLFSSPVKSVTPPPIGWNVKGKSPVGGPPPAYPGLEKIPGGNAPPVYSKNPPPRPPPPYSATAPVSAAGGAKSPPSYESVMSEKHQPPLRPPPPYSAAAQQPMAPLLAPGGQPPIAAYPVQPAVTVMNIHPQPAQSSSMFGGNWLSNALFFGLGSSMGSRDSTSTIHHYHDSSPTANLAPIVNTTEITITSTTETSSLLSKLKP